MPGWWSFVIVLIVCERQSAGCFVGVLMQDRARCMIFLRCKLTADRADGWEGYLGFARTSWYGTTHIQITHTKRTFGYIQISAIKKELLPGGLRWCLRCQVKVKKWHSNHTHEKAFTSMLIWRMKQARKSRRTKYGVDNHKSCGIITRSCVRVRMRAFYIY